MKIFDFIFIFLKKKNKNDAYLVGFQLYLIQSKHTMNGIIIVCLTTEFIFNKLVVFGSVIFWFSREQSRLCIFILSCPSSDSIVPSLPSRRKTSVCLFHHIFKSCKSTNNNIRINGSSRLHQKDSSLLHKFPRSLASPLTCKLLFPRHGHQ